MLELLLLGTEELDDAEPTDEEAGIAIEVDIRVGVVGLATLLDVGEEESNVDGVVGEGFVSWGLGDLSIRTVVTVLPMVTGVVPIMTGPPKGTVRRDSRSLASDLGEGDSFLVISTSPCP